MGHLGCWPASPHQSQWTCLHHKLLDFLHQSRKLDPEEDRIKWFIINPKAKIFNNPILREIEHSRDLLNSVKSVKEAHDVSSSCILKQKHNVFAKAALSQIHHFHGSFFSDPTYFCLPPWPLYQTFLSWIKEEKKPGLLKSLLKITSFQTWAVTEAAVSGWRWDKPPHVHYSDSERKMQQSVTKQCLFHAWSWQPEISKLIYRLNDKPNVFNWFTLSNWSWKAGIKLI